MAQRYKVMKKSGALQEAMSEQIAQELNQLSEIQSFDAPIQQMANFAPPAPMVAEAKSRARSVGLPMLGTQRMPAPNAMGGAPAPSRGGGRDPTAHQVKSGMWFTTVPDGQRVLVTDKQGRMEVVVGPRRIWRVGRRIAPMQHFVAHPGDFLVVRYRDGRQEHLPGPAEVWQDPREHLSIEREEVVQIADKEAVVVYAEAEEGTVSRRTVHGPATFVPGPGEWLHTFSWHGPAGDGTYRKVPNKLVFQKLWRMPDQMYHDVEEVRTADDAQLTIKLMIFFELVDIDQMMQATHDPIGDFVNAATSDVVEFLSRLAFDAFKKDTDRLNDLTTYRNLTARANQCGYKIDKVVYRGYGAPAALQQMHDQATESRIRLQLERATEQQAQELEDLKLERTVERAAKERARAADEFAHKLELQRRAQVAEQRNKAEKRAAERQQALADARQEAELSEAARAHERAHFAALRELGVDLTALLTQGRADRVLEVRGAGTTHLHVPGDGGGVG